MTQTPNTSNQPTAPLAPGDNVVATETIRYGYGHRAEYVERGTYGVVAELTSHPQYNAYIEWDTGVAGSTDSASVARSRRR